MVATLTNPSVPALQPPEELDIPIPVEFQESTFQLPCGPNSIFDPPEGKRVRPFSLMTFCTIYYHGNWSKGKSHNGLSARNLAKMMHVKYHSRVVRAIAELEEKGWLKKEKRGGSKALGYQLTLHNCEPDQIPYDKDGRPKTCATPSRAGSPIDRMFKGEITWEECLVSIHNKVRSDWCTGVLKATIAEIRSWVGMATQTVCDVVKSLTEKGLMQRLTGKCDLSAQYQLFPKPYEHRRQRRHENPKMMPSDSKFYYSFNRRWKICRETGNFFTKVLGTRDKWRFSNDFELESINIKIFNDFVRSREAILWRQGYLAKSKS